MDEPANDRILKLDDEEIVTFDQDFVSDDRFASITTCIERDFPSGRFSFVDVGGGNGKFTDRLLDRFPNAEGHLVDNSALLVSRNARREQKTTHVISVEDMPRYFAGRTFDLVMFNYSLHHFVVRSYSATRGIQRTALRNAVELLGPNGRLSVLENLCDSFVPGFSGRFVHLLTTSHTLAPAVKRLGANTAGTGVCFLDRHEWRDEIQRAGFHVVHFEPEFYQHDVSKSKKRLLLMKDWRSGHYWATRAS